MKTLNFDDRESWLAARKGKITGSRLKDIIVKRGTGKKIGFYELIAERIAVDHDGENVMDRGTRLEEEAIKCFEKATGKKVNQDLVIWCREDNDCIAISPDGIVEGENAAVEAKCLSSARHIEAWYMQKVPDEYEYQIMQYFIVNDKLETMYMLFYDPRIPCKDFFFLTVHRKDVQAEIDACLEYQRQVIAEVNQIVNDLTF